MQSSAEVFQNLIYNLYSFSTANVDQVLNKLDERKGVGNNVISRYTSVAPYLEAKTALAAAH